MKQKALKSMERIMHTHICRSQSHKFNTDSTCHEAHGKSVNRVMGRGGESTINEAIKIETKHVLVFNETELSNN